MLSLIVVALFSKGLYLHRKMRPLVNYVYMCIFLFPTRSGQIGGNAEDDSS